MNPVERYERPYPWEIDVTVCIAATCDAATDDPKIVVCFDRKMSSSLGSPEVGLKLRSLVPNRWRCLTSGTETDILATVRLLERSLIRADGGQPEGIDEAKFLPATRAALNERKREKTEEYIQGKYGISCESFLANGRTQLPEDLFRHSVAEIEMIRIEAEFIIVGYLLGFPALIRTDTKCGASIRENFVAIGEGAYLAQASLLNREQRDLNSLGETIYGVFEAKKFAEGAPTVGKATGVSIFHKDGTQEFITGEGLVFLDQTHAKLTRRSIPELEIKAEYFKKLVIPTAK